MPTIPSHLLTQPEWQVIDLICNGKFGHDGRVWSHINCARESVDFDAILDEKTWSSSELLLLTTAASLWSGSGHPISIGRLANTLGDGSLHTWLKALAVYRGAALPMP